MHLMLLPVFHVVTLLAQMTSAGREESEKDGGGQSDNLLGDDPYLPSFLPTPTNVTFLTGQEAMLQCAIENRGTRTIVWRRASDPNPLTIGEDTYVGDRRFYVRHQKHSLEWNLHIREVKPQDSGIYECQVITRSRDIRQMVLLRVDDTQFVPAYKPVVNFTLATDIQISGSQFVEKGNTLSLSCNATGFDYPPDELDWFKDGLKLTTGARLTIRKDVSLAEKTFVSKLQIARASMVDAGTYVCRASDMQVTSAKVNVLNTDTNNEKRDKPDLSTFGLSSYRSSSGPVTLTTPSKVTTVLLTIFFFFRLY